MKNKKTSLLPGGVSSVFGSPFDTRIERGKGSHCWDQFGNPYIDFINGYGPIILGHAHEEVNEAVYEQMQKGVLFPSKNILFDDLKLILLRLFPYYNDCLFLKTGSEAASAAVRLARAYTRRNVIIKCGFHGWHDTFMTTHLPWHDYEKAFTEVYHPVGTSQSVTADVVYWDGNHLQDLFDIFQKNKNKIAALILDPVQVRTPLSENFAAIHRMTQTENALLIFDEIKTGFRVSLTGAQGLHAIQPDITLLSKGISNGFPLSVVLGHSDIIGLAGKAKIMGTFNNELLAIVAAIKTISILERPENTNEFNRKGDILLRTLNEVFKKLGVNNDIVAIPYMWQCMPYLLFSDSFKPFRKDFYTYLTHEGVLLLENHMNFISLAHTQEDIEQTVQKIENVLTKKIIKNIR